MLDRRDRLILYELDKNARVPLSKIAKKAWLSRETVLYRTRKYFSGGIIRQYLTIINLAKIGYTHHKIYAVLHNITEEKEKKLISDLLKDPNIGWVASCDGKYSLIFTILAKNLIELNEKIKSLHKKYGEYFSDLEITSIIKAYHYPRDYLIQAKSRSAAEKVRFRGGEKEDFALDDTDAEILESLSEDSRVSAVDIARKIKVHPGGILNRIKKLEKANLIVNYMIWPNVNKLIGNYFKVLVKLNNVEEESEKKLYTYCQNNPHIVYIVYCLGSWQFEMDIEVSTTEEFRKIMRQFLSEFSSSVLQYTALNIYQEYKFKLFDKQMLKNK